MSVEPTKSSMPWYRRFREQFLLASRWMATFSVSQTGDVSRETLQAFEQETLMRFIFESNNMEREGPSLGETRELILSELMNNPELAEWNQAISMLQQNVGVLRANAQIDLKAVEIQSVKSTRPRTIKLIASHGKKKKDARLVHQQLTCAVVGSLISAGHYAANRFGYTMWRFQSVEMEIEDNETRQDIQEKVDLARAMHTNLLAAHEDYFGRYESTLLSEGRIKLLHQAIASGLIDKKHAQAGEYRHHPVMVDMETHFPAPSDVPRAMANFIRQYREMEQAEAHPIVLASWAATQFVKIHPFSDFNGRVSRLILNMVLRSYGFPFWLAVKSNKKDRDRYFYAIRRSWRDGGKAMATLVSMQINDTFERFNQELELIGYDLLDPQGKLPEIEDWDGNQLMEMRWPIGSILSARDEYIAQCKSLGVSPEPIDDSPDADPRLKLPAAEST